MYSLCVACLSFHNIQDKQSVKKFISQFSGFELMGIDVPAGTWQGNHDILGFIYQSLMAEGERNLTGQYYTSRNVVDYMLDNKHLADGETFLDPCCGSGAFLLAVHTDTPECLYGFDINPIAVMIAGTNLLVKYSEYDFVPNVFCLDFLKKDLFDSGRQGIPFQFDNIYTNPPWGADKEGLYIDNYSELKSKERASMVIVESLKRLKTNGNIYFILPTSLLKIKTHVDVRKYMLYNTAIQRIDLYSDRFDGVFTDYFSIKLSASPTRTQTYAVTTGNETRYIKLSESDLKAGSIVLEQLTHLDDSIVAKMEGKRHDDLRHSQWALGIVTGDNKNKVKKEMATGLEPVYTGKQVAPFKLQKGASYILFAPESFQQCAKEEYFRAPEKLMYRFIAKYPIVAYDDKQCLCLNSANILIPDIDGMSIKSVAALLNSSLYRYYYSIKFSDIKVLKGEDTPRKGNLRVLYWNIQDGMWADQAANYNNFVKWVKRYDPDICIWCEAASIYRTGTDISAPTAERFLPDGWPTLAARYGHSYYALSGKRDNFPQEITSKYPVTTLLKITDTDVSGKPVAHGAAIQQVEVNGRKINFVTCHMWPQGYGFGVTGEDAQEASKAAHEGDYHRRFEMQYIIDHTVNDPEYANEDWILVGDMNSRSRKDNWYYGYADDSTVLITQDVVLQQTNLLDIIAETWPGTFCSSTYGNARIDFMYASPSMMTRVVDAGFVLDKWTIPHKTPYFYDPSDHRPILVDFQL